MIQTYFDQIKAVLDAYAATHTVLHSQITFETRPGEQGYLHGSITFQDGSILYFREYLDVVGTVVHREMYSYQYQDAANQLRFRYDNATHRPPLDAREHKHTADHIITGVAPTLPKTLAEIVSSNGWIP